MGFLDWLFGKKHQDMSRVGTENKESASSRFQILKTNVNQEYAHAVDAVHWGVTDLTLEIKDEVKSAVMESLARGVSWANCKAKNHLPMGFKWEEYTTWENRIRRMRRPPDIFEYYGQREMYISVLITQAVELTQLQEWERQGIKRVRFVVSDDSCPLCKEIKKIYEIKNAPMVGKERHPGCRCGFIPML